MKLSKLERRGARIIAKPEARKPTKTTAKVRYYYKNQAGSTCYCDSRSMSPAMAQNTASYYMDIPTDLIGAAVIDDSKDSPWPNTKEVVLPSQLVLTQRPERTELEQPELRVITAEECQPRVTLSELQASEAIDRAVDGIALCDLDLSPIQPTLNHMFSCERIAA